MIEGGNSGQADAIDFTGGINSLTLNTTTANGGLTGGLGLGGMVTITPDAGGTTLTSVLHDFSGTVTGSLVKTEPGTLTLSGANTYTGGTTLNAGELDLGNSAALGTGALAMAQGTTLGFTASGLTISNAINIAGDPTYDVEAGQTETVSGNISDTDPANNPGVVEKTGAGTLVLSGQNTYSGGTILNAGTLELGRQTSAGTGAITFGTAGETLQVDADGGTLEASVTDFAANDVIDFAALNATGATARYANGALTVSGTATAGGAAAAEAIAIAAAPSGEEYAVSRDANGHAEVTLVTIPAPTITAPANGKDTNNNEPTISGTGEVGDTVILTVSSSGGTSFVAGAQVMANGTWSITPQSPLSDGSYTASATETSPSGTGHSAPSTAETFTVDTTPPTIAITAPVAGDNTINAAEAAQGITISGTTTAEDGQTVRVQILNVDATAVDTYTDTASGGAYSVEVTPAQAQALQDGIYTVTADVSDKAGNPAMEAMQTITVDETAPKITTVMDAGPGVDANGNGDLGAGKTVTLTLLPSEAVYVTSGSGGAIPTLTLNDGATATYTGPIGSPTRVLTFSYTVAAGQNTAKLAVTAVNANGATVTDAAGNPISTSLAGASVPSGTLVIDTTAPTASSPTVTVAQNAGPTPIGIAAPNDNLTPSGSLAIVAGSQPTDGTVTLADGTTRVTTGENLTVAQLTGLEFIPTPGAFGQTSAFTYTVTDGAGNATTGAATLDVGSPGAPIISGLQPVQTNLQEAMQPFASATVTDPSAGAQDRLTITPSGAVGTLAGAGLVDNGDGTYTLAFAAPATLTQELEALTFGSAITNGGPLEATSFALTLDSISGASSSASTSYTVNSYPNQNDFGTTTTSASSSQGEVYTLYEGLLDRAPDPIGGEQAVAQLQAGTPLDQLTQGILTSAEGASYFTAGSSNGDFVNQLYERVLGRVDSYGEQAYWDQQLANGASRADVADAFVFSQEHTMDLQPAFSAGVFTPDNATSEAARLYYGLFDRAPDSTGLQDQAEALHGGTPLTTVAQSFLSSPEYGADNPAPVSNQGFVNALFENAVGRTPDQGGYWTQQLDSGAQTRSQVAVGIVESSEAQQHLLGRIETGYHIA